MPERGTIADMIMRTPDGVYNIFNIGNNGFLSGASVFNTPNLVGADWNFAGMGTGSNSANSSGSLANPGGVNWDFARRKLDMFLRNPTTGAFTIYRLSPDQPGPPGTNLSAKVPTSWNVAGFGTFFRNNRGQQDIMMRQVGADGIATYRPYNTVANTFSTSTSSDVARVSATFQTAGFGLFAAAPNPASNPVIMVLRDPSGGTLYSYAITKGTGAPTNGAMKTNGRADQIGTNVDILAVGKFSGTVPLGMLGWDKSSGTFYIWDITQNKDNPGTYSAASSSPTGAGATVGFGDVTGGWRFAGFAQTSTSGGILVLKAGGVAANQAVPFSFYSIANDKITTITNGTATGSMGNWMIGGIGADKSLDPSSLVQAMASFNAGSNSAAALTTTASLGADTSQQQPLLTIPQHA